MGRNGSRNVPYVRWTQKQKEKFLAAVRRTGNITASCLAMGWKSRMPYYNLVRDGKNPELAKEVEEAMEEACDRLELEARRRGMHGYKKPIYYKGVRVDYVREHSDLLLLALLRAHRPDKFARREVEPEQRDVDLSAWLHALEGAAADVWGVPDETD